MFRLSTFIFSVLTVCVRLLLPGGARKIAAENIAIRSQLITLTRNSNRSPKLTIMERIIYGYLTSMISPKRLSKIAIVLKPATLLKFHRALVKKKYHLFFSNKSFKKPGPKGPSQPLIDAIVEMKKRNPGYGYRHIAMQISNAFGVEIDKDIVRRVLNTHYNNSPNKYDGPSWLTFIGHMKDSLWSVDFFRAESIHLKTHWIMVCIDQFTRRIIGFAVHNGDLTGSNVCRMFNEIISQKSLPKYLSSDNDPLFQYHRWQANLRILEIEEIKSVPYTPRSHPFIERLIGTVRRELLDKTFFWNEHDLQNKLNSFQHYYNENRCHHGIDGYPPSQKSNDKVSTVVPLENYQWEKKCQGLFELPVAA